MAPPRAKPALPPGPVLIVADNASARTGGEASIPLTYFRFLRKRGADAHLLVHARCKPELSALLPEERGRIHYIRDTRLQHWVWRLTYQIPGRLTDFTFGFLIQFITQFRQRRVARELIKKFKIAVVHQPTPVSPRMPSMMYGLGAPVVIGPMNGDMNFPPAFRSRERAITRWSIAVLRKMSNAMHSFMPGKRKAAVLLVANERTRQALPKGLRGQVIQFCENGVDLSLWQVPPGVEDEFSQHALRVAFAGRLIDLKGVDLLLEATARAQQRLTSGARIQLNIIGDGEIAAELRQKADALGLNGSVHFLGWRSQKEVAAQLAASDALAMPSLCDCGGAVVLEAMALGLPVIAANWGGPADYVDSSCGVLVEPTSREAFVAGLENAMVELASRPDVRKSLGSAGQHKAHSEYDWQVRIDHMIEIYRRAVQSVAPPFARAR